MVKNLFSSSNVAGQSAPADYHHAGPYFHDLAERGAVEQLGEPRHQGNAGRGVVHWAAHRK